MAGGMGWTSWGWAKWPGEGEFRVWKHYTGPLIAVHDGFEGDSLSLLSQMSEWLELEAGVEREPDELELARHRREVEEWQTAQDIKAAAVRLDAENTRLIAENAELKRRLEEAGLTESS